MTTALLIVLAIAGIFGLTWLILHMTDRADERWEARLRRERLLEGCETPPWRRR